MKLTVKSKEQFQSKLLYLLLMRNEKYSFLLELLEEVGDETMGRLLQIFSGSTIQFPSMLELERLAKQITIYYRIRCAPKSQQASIVKLLSDEYLLDEHMVLRHYHSMVQLVEKDLKLRIA